MTLEEANEMRDNKILRGYRISESLWAQATKVIQEAAESRRLFDLATKPSRAEIGRVTKPNRSEYAVARKLAAVEKLAAARVVTPGMAERREVALRQGAH